jgi:N-acetylmuramic acid 6-phosphate etherase
MTGIPTEGRNPRSAGLDRLDSRSILAIMSEEDSRCAAAVAAALDDLARAADLAARALSGGGRLVYFGAGTSGRLAAGDAAELLPTFGLGPDRVFAVVAGGDAALRAPVEGAEDDAMEGVALVRDHGLGAGDCVVGVTASGSTRFVLGAMGEAREKGASTVLLTCGRPASPGLWDVCVVLDTGPEVVAGSTRLKAGTATKMALNMISTAAAARIGRVYDNLMVEVRCDNEKLRRRGAVIVHEATGVSPDAARRLLLQCGGEVKTAIVMARTGLDPETARARLAAHGGRLRETLEAR